MQNKSIETNDPVVERLCSLARERPDLKDAARVYEVILPLLRDASLRVVPVSLSSEEAREKMEKGIPLLSGPDLELDEQAVRHLMLRLAHSMENVSGMQNPCESGTVGRVRLAIEENKIDFGALLSNVLAADHDFIESIARDIDLDPDLVRVLTRYALKPALNAWRRQLAPLAEGLQWDKGYCFICGADATLGELRENGQALYLRCGQCGADWQFRRLKCIWCGNEDHRIAQLPVQRRSMGKDAGRGLRQVPRLPEGHHLVFSNTTRDASGRRSCDAAS